MLNAIVIQFPKRPVIPSQASPDVTGTAQVIIFPGVHYLRLEDDEDIFAVATAPLKSPSKRK
jgi:hypothetical protein